MDNYVLEMTDISKEFPGVKALDNVSLKVKPGTVHALLGENGAGKSTLMKCLIGIYKKDSGSILYKGNPLEVSNPSVALKSGISMIHQELNPVLERTVNENIWIGREPTKGKTFLVDHKRMKQDTIDLLNELELKTDPEAKLSSLSVSQMQMVEIAKAVSYDASIVVMDEPTSALTNKEAEHLFSIIQQLKNRGTAIIYISHKMDEIFRICDEYTVFRDGKMVASGVISETNPDEIISKMVGREIVDIFPKTICEIKDTILKVENLSSEKRFRNVSFELRRGEILGFAGLVGAGRTEIAEAICGVRKISSGKILKNGKAITIRKPRDAFANGIAMLTEDRRRSGIFPVLSISDNTVISHIRAYLWKGFLFKHKKAEKDANEYVKKLRIKTPNLSTQIKNLSGGNQQKVLLARLLLTDPDILIFDEPTRGIDVGAKSEIHELIGALASEGKAVITISSEMSELLCTCDRILVMHEGDMTGIVERKEATQELIMKFATGQ